MSKWIAFGFLVAYATQLATSQNHFESYTQVKYRTNTIGYTVSRVSCTSGWFWGKDKCNTVYYWGYRTVTESVTETHTRCQRGWSPPNICNVLNPCESGTSGCQQRCYYGGRHATYVCSCIYGYELETDGHRCKNMDECTKRGHDCRGIGNSICQYTSEGYQCICKNGFTLVAPQRCSDLDECVTGTDNCNASKNFVCQNTIGGYECVCRQGFLLDDSRRCIDLDECVAGTDNCNASENFVCQNTIGGYECVCRQGFLLDESQHCIDIDECVTLIDSCNASDNTVCQNTIGDYACVCIQGFPLNESQQCTGLSWPATDNVVGIYAATGIGGVIVTATVVVTICVCYRKKRKAVIERVVTTEAAYENSSEMFISTQDNEYVDADPCAYQQLSVALNGPDQAEQNVYETLRNAEKRRRKTSSDNKTSKM